MGKRKISDKSEPVKRVPPALTPEAEENQIISLAFDVVKERLINRTASSQEVTCILKLGSTRERLEKEILEKQKDLIGAKTEALQSAQRIEELYANALNAIREYSGQGGEDEY